MKNTTLYVDIDTSINSTDITIINYNSKIVDIQFYIVKPNKLTKKESDIEKHIDNFSYVLYHKCNINDYKNDNHLYEYHKTCNMINIVTTIYDIISLYVKNSTNKFDSINIVIEGISYGSSLRTKSIFDLSGLNYMIRYKFICDIILDINTNITIATPSNIKKFITGKGNASKDMIITMFKAIFPNMNKLPKLDDIADSYFMSYFALELDKKNGTIYK